MFLCSLMETKTDTTPEYLSTAGLIVLKDGRLLLAYSNNKKAWYLPGGKIDAGESPLQALIREIREEMSVELISEKIIESYTIIAPAYGENNLIMLQRCFRYPPQDNFQAGNEIDGLRYFNREEYSREPAQVPGVIEVFDRLDAAQ